MVIKLATTDDRPSAPAPLEAVANDTTELLEALTAIPAISGREAPVAEFLRARWRPFIDGAHVDRLGNLVAERRGASDDPRLLLAAHMDQIGFLVRGREAGGFLRVSPVGGWDRRLLVAQEVVVHGRRPVIGLVGSRPPHLTRPADRDKVPEIEDLVIDTGLDDAELDDCVRPGDQVTPRSAFLRLLNGRVSAAAIDDRAGLAAVSVALAELAASGHACRLMAVGTVQEEIGAVGAQTAAFELRPDLAVAIDVGFGQHPGAEEDSFSLDSGPTILVGANAHPAVSALLREAAKAADLPHEVEIVTGSSGTDAWTMQVAGDGMATAVVSIPLRYMHTPVETVSVEDIRRTGKLLAELARRFDAEVAKQWKR